MAEAGDTRLTAENPWPGLSPFAEGDKDYFHGRDAEIGELARLVRREPLTVLFGRSGLGKTSLLAAGLFPLLRPDHYLPVYIRLGHSSGAPLALQAHDEVSRACQAWDVEGPAPLPDATLWELLQRIDAKFWSPRNRPVVPVLVFDQFEEIFTLGQETEAARQRSEEFLEEL